MMNANARNRSPFTATQWQELELQALIFKYMVAGIPIPPDLLYSVKRGLESSISSRLFPHRPISVAAVSWECFEMGFGRKVDPEPGRCRRTDGKKWRCSKEAYPDSKYCERHMNRGRNRSRKPVEVTSTATTTTNVSPTVSSINRNLTINTTTIPTTSTFSVSPLSNSSVSSETNPHHPYHEATLYPFLYSHSSSSRPPVSGLLPQNNITHQLFLDSRSYSQADKDYSFFQGAKEGVDEKAFFPEASGTSKSLPDSYQRSLTTDSYKGYSHTQFQSLTDSAKQQQEQHCFVLGTDFKSPGLVKTEKNVEVQKPLHQFFGEWPPKNTDSWLDLASNSRLPTDD
ncbi:hypothetical protein F2P56_027898 [Juglans regia]|uniref:Growth-regulating factor n=1 Tax=Juglans regia TaxID=51240 RepID=A0A833WZI0_JUGRE|nr:hypothetical protein F2P56_027898 [Juglans regia]